MLAGEDAYNEEGTDAPARLPQALTKLTVQNLKVWLAEARVAFPAAAKKDELLQLYNEVLTVAPADLFDACEQRVCVSTSSAYTAHGVVHRSKRS